MKLATCMDSQEGLKWLIDNISRDHEPLDRHSHALALDFLHQSPPESIVSAWEKRADALLRYRAALPTPSALWKVLSSLLHMHHNRVFGPDRRDETALLKLTRAVALTLMHCQEHP